jgi:hypothetical protein
MAQYKRNGFKDDPTVLVELVKFMVVNTGFEALEVLVVKVKAMEDGSGGSNIEEGSCGGNQGSVICGKQIGRNEKTL